MAPSTITYYPLDLRSVWADFFFYISIRSRFKNNITGQTAVAYISTIITFILLVGVIIYHVYLMVRKDRPRGEGANVYHPLAPVQPATKAEVTYSVIEIPKPRDQSPPPEEQCDLIEVKEILCTATLVHQYLHLIISQ